MSRQHPSILVVFADQMRGRDMGCAGNHDVLSPTLDQLAQDGILLRRCYANTPVCTPNRGSLLTGLFPTSHGALVNDIPIRPNIESIGTVTRRYGYSTGYIGKWHLDGVPRNKFTPPGPRRLGFDFWAVHNCSHSYFQPRYYRDMPDMINDEGYEPVIQTDLALQFLNELNDDQSFCLFVSWGPPHDPYDQVPEVYRDRYDPGNLNLPTNIKVSEDRQIGVLDNIKRTFADYYAAITALDEQLQRLLDKLVQLKRRSDTIVVFTSDHGDMLWSHGFGQKQLPYEESVHVPCIISWPDSLPSNTITNNLCSTVDLMPTLLSLARIPSPQDLHGVDISSHLVSDVQAQDDVLLGIYCRQGASIQQNTPEWRGLRTNRWTYTETADRRPWMLFDNDADPWQQTNLASNPDYVEDLKKLGDRLSERLMEIQDPFLDSESMIDYFGLRTHWTEIKDWAAELRNLLDTVHKHNLSE